MKKFRRYTKICPLCGCEFECNNRGRVYCSNSCKQQSYYKREEVLMCVAKKDYEKYVSEHDYKKNLKKDGSISGLISDMLITHMGQNYMSKIVTFDEFYKNYKMDFKNKLQQWKQQKEDKKL